MNRRRSTSARRSASSSSSSIGSKTSTRSRSRDPKKQLDEEYHMLHAQIGQLENFIASSPHRERKRWFDNMYLVPPPDTAAGRRRSSASPRMSRRESKEVRQERHRHLFTFVCLLGAVCAMLYWLLNAADL